MTILFADGFEDWTDRIGEYDASQSLGLSIASGGRNGGSLASFGNSNDFLEKWLSTTYSELFAAVAFANANLGGDWGNVLSFYNGSTLQLSLQVSTGADRAVRVVRGDGTVLGTSANNVAAASVFTQFQIRVVFSDTVGVVEVRAKPVGGSPSTVINLSGIDTNNGGSSLANRVRLGATGAGNGQEGSYDDLVVWNTTGSIANTWLGDVRVDSRRPASNGDSSQFVGSDGNSTDNYLLVDGAAPNGTDYVESSTVNNKDLYGISALTHYPTSIYGVYLTGAALRSAIDARSVRMLMKAGGTEVDNGAHIALTNSRARIGANFETNPSTSAAWTRSGLAAAQIGQKVSV